MSERGGAAMRDLCEACGSRAAGDHFAELADHRSVRTNLKGRAETSVGYGCPVRGMPRRSSGWRGLDFGWRVGSRHCPGPRGPGFSSTAVVANGRNSPGDPLRTSDHDHRPDPTLPPLLARRPAPLSLPGGGPAALARGRGAPSAHARSPRPPYVTLTDVLARSHRWCCSTVSRTRRRADARFHRDARASLNQSWWRCTR